MSREHTFVLLLSAVMCLSKAVLNGLILGTRRTLEFLARSEQQREGDGKRINL